MGEIKKLDKNKNMGKNKTFWTQLNILNKNQNLDKNQNFGQK